jgi:chromosome segregation ATPase
MKLIKYSKFLALGLLLSSCASQTQLQTAIDNSKRLETLIEKERAENDQLNAQRSVLESQIQASNSQIQRLQSEKQVLTDNLNTVTLKSKEEKSKLETKIKALEATILQQSENNQKAVEALGEKINDLADDKRELINEKYKAKKAVKKRRRRR